MTVTKTLKASRRNLVIDPSIHNPPPIAISLTDQLIPAQPPSTPSSTTSPSFHHPVPLGHPTRPYYSAIRKQGISPPSSTPSSRPNSHSQLPKSGPSAHRHLSLSVVPHISAFTLDDDDDEEPVRTSFGTSLTTAAKSLARKRSISGPSAFPHSISPPPFVLPPSIAHSNSSLPTLHGPKRFRMSAPTSAVGFSVSGETELKIALALSEAHTNDGGIPFVTVPTSTIQEEPSPSSPHTDTFSNSLANRVKKLKRGLKHIFTH